MRLRLRYLLIITVVFAAHFTRGYAQAPVINSFSPASGIIGSSVTITGNNFNPSTGGNIVYFGATRAVVISASATSLTVKVPVGATFQPITVLNYSTNLTASGAYPFHVTFPSKSTITPSDFDARVDFAAAESPTRITIGDLDGDGRPDMAIVYQNTNAITLYHNVSSPGSISLSSFEKITLPNNLMADDVVFGDIDGDGKLDMITANSGTNSISFFQNKTIPNILNAFSFGPRIDLSVGEKPTGVRISDLDGDGKPDLVVTYSYLGTTMSVIKNNNLPLTINPGLFEPRIDLSTGNGFISPLIADLNHDNKPEIILAETAFDRISVFENISTPGSLSAASFKPKQTFTTQSLPANINLGDMNLDGIADFVTGNYGATFLPEDVSNTRIGILKGNITTGPVNSSSYSVITTRITNPSPLSVALDDLDGDGKLDLVSANAYTDDISIFHNKSAAGSVAFDISVNIPSGLKPLNVKIADIDGDGKPDIIVTNSNSQTVSIYRNNSLNLQSITFPPIPIATYGNADFAPGAVTNNPGNPIVYTSSDPTIATITPGGTIHIIRVGTVTITANQNATANTEAAQPKSQELTVLPAPLIIKADDKTRDYRTTNPPLTATYTGLVNGDDITGLGITFQITTAAEGTSQPANYTINATGDVSSANYTITYTNGILTVTKLAQTISFDALESKIIGGADFMLTATASSGLPVIYTSANADIASITGNTVQLNKVGTVNITATQPGNEIYEPATAIIRALKIAPVDVIVLSNTITPNNDGINDTWKIIGLDYDYNGTVTIVNRNGSTVFQSRGYPIPFNGTRNGKKLPAGVYYYVINFTDGRRALSGSLTILY